LSRFRVVSTQAQPAHATVEVGSIGVEAARGFGDVPGGPGEGAFDQLALVGVEGGD
jgi:hypothetical protein